MPFLRLAKELTRGRRGSSDYRFQSSALEALRVAAEDYIVTMFKSNFYVKSLQYQSLTILDANLCAIHGKRVTIQQKDIQLVRSLCNGWIMN